MNRQDIAGVLGAMDNASVKAEVLNNVAVARRAANRFWWDELRTGHLTEEAMRAARGVAAELSLITDGALHLVGRAPDGVIFGALSSRTIA